jgi:hypothetical protein
MIAATETATTPAPHHAHPRRAFAVPIAEAMPMPIAAATTVLMKSKHTVSSYL